MDWNSCIATSQVIERLLRHDPLETRDLLKPLFKLCKETSRSFDFEIAFQYASFLVQLSRVGWEEKAIPPMTHVQPRYAYNTLIVMAQRISRADYALRAHQCMLEHQLEPDVFTMTALIDVVGRHVSLERAEVFFRSMLDSTAMLPNIVTLVTMLRLARISEDSSIGLRIVFSVLTDAAQLHTRLSSPGLHSSELFMIAGTIVSDISLYNAALAACVRLSTSCEDAARVLRQAATFDVSLNDLSLQILAKLHLKLTGDDVADISPWITEFLTPEQALQMLVAVEERKQRSGRRDNEVRVVYSGCLGSTASPAMRQSVISHDLMKLLDRVDPLLGGDARQLSESDFATLVHQARKRKWGTQVTFIFDFAVKLSEEGYPARGILPQCALAPSAVLFEACINAYFSMAMVDEARQLYLLVKEESPAAFEEDSLVYSVVKGFVQCGSVAWAVDCYHFTAVPGVLRNKLLRGLLRGLGKTLQLGISVLAGAARLFLDESISPLDLQELLLLFLQSVAIIGSAGDLEALLLGDFDASADSPRGCDCLKLVLRRLVEAADPAIVSALLLCCGRCRDIQSALELARRFHHLKLLRGLFVASTLLKESFAACTTALQQSMKAAALTTLPFRSFALVGALKFIDSRRTLISILYSSPSSLHRDQFLMQLDDACSACSNRDSPSETDIELEALFAVLDADAANDLSSSIGILLNQRLHTLWLGIKSREAMFRVNSLIAQTIGDRSHLRLFRILCSFLSGCSAAALGIAPKVLVKLLRVLAEAIDFGPLSAVEVSVIADLCRRQLPCLEIVKEMNKLYHLDVSAEGLSCLCDCITQLLRSNRETAPSRIIPFAASLGLLCDICSEAVISSIADAIADDATELHAGVLFVKAQGECKDDVGLALARVLIERNAVDCACRLLLQCDIDSSPDPDMHSILNATSALLSQYTLPCVEEVGDFYELPRDIEIVFVDNESALELAKDALISSPHVGIDVEWRPSRLQEMVRHNKCSLLQLSTPNKVFLFDLLLLENEVDAECRALYRTTIADLMEATDILKIGFGLRYDWSRLCQSYPSTFRGDLSDFHVVDLKISFPEVPSLSLLAMETVGLPLRKSMQVSDWEARPLSDEQVKYAALDAYVLIAIWLVRDEIASVASSLSATIIY